MKHAWLYFDLFHVLKGEPLSFGFSTYGSLIYMSTVPQCMVLKEKVPFVITVYSTFACGMMDCVLPAHLFVTGWLVFHSDMSSWLTGCEISKNSLSLYKKSRTDLETE